MKIVGLEEHYVTPDVLKAWQGLDSQWQDPSMGSAERQGTSAALARGGTHRRDGRRGRRYPGAVVDHARPVESGRSRWGRAADGVQRRGRRRGARTSRPAAGLRDPGGPAPGGCGRRIGPRSKDTRVPWRTDLQPRARHPHRSRRILADLRGCGGPRRAALPAPAIASRSGPGRLLRWFRRRRRRRVRHPRRRLALRRGRGVAPAHPRGGLRQIPETAGDLGPLGRNGAVLSRPDRPDDTDCGVAAQHLRIPRRATSTSLRAGFSASATYGGPSRSSESNASCSRRTTRSCLPTVASPAGSSSRPN